jgi:hypothetical protein
VNRTRVSDQATPNAYRESLHKARADWQSVDPVQAAARADAGLARGTSGSAVLEVPFFGAIYRAPHPAGSVTSAATGRPASPASEILLLHYLLTADGTLPTGEWVSFHELPSGLIYQSAFAARSLAPLGQAFGRDADAFATAARACGGEAMRLGDASFWFRVLPRLGLAAVLWLGEEDLPGAVNVLFDSSAGHCLPTEDLAAVGGMLSGRLLRARPSGGSAS